VGAPDAVDLPQPGAIVHANGTAFRIHKREADVRVLSPVDGEVVEAGGAGRSLYLKVKPLDGKMDMRHLLCGAEIKPWLMREMERLQLALSAEGAAPTLADGGVPVADIAQSYPEADGDAVCGEMFLEPEGDQRLSGLARSLEIVNGPRVSVPVIRCVDDVRNAALLQQFHKRDAFEAQLVGSLARRDSAIRKKGENGFFPLHFLESGLVGGIVGNVDLNLQFHGTFIVPL
jgi:hypothetical protein